jgi:hypothetical protein
MSLAERHGIEADPRLHGEHVIAAPEHVAEHGEARGSGLLGFCEAFLPNFGPTQALEAAKVCLPLSWASQIHYCFNEHRLIQGISA